MAFEYLDISRMIDHSLLKPSMTVDDFEVGCRLAWSIRRAAFVFSHTT